MPKQTTEIECQSCNRNIEGEILKEYIVEIPKSEQQNFRYNHFQKIKVKEHKTGKFFKPICNGSNRSFSILFDQTWEHHLDDHS